MRLFIALAALLATGVVALAASGQRPPPSGSLPHAPPEFTQFTAAELTRGFMALAFGSDLRIGSKPKGVRKFDGVARVRVMDSGSVNRAAEYRAVLREFAVKVPSLRVELVDDGDAEMTVRLIDEGDFVRAMEDAFGRKVARAFVARTDPQCMTSVKSSADGRILQVHSFIIVDQGDDVFRDCAYHETLHAFGLSNHDDKNGFTTLNQNRTVGYLSVYDRALLTALYDPRIQAGMPAREVQRLLPAIFADIMR